MKKIIVFIVLFISLDMSAQKWEKSANLNYNWTYLSQSVEGDLNLRKNHSVVSFGMQVYVNQYPDFEDGSYKNVGYAGEWYNRIGLNVSYQYNIFKDIRTVNPFLFCQSLVSHLNFQKPATDGIGIDGRGVELTEPYWIIENVIGAGFVFQLYKNLHVYQSAGYGYSFFSGDDTYTMSINGEWAYTLKIGLLYMID
jgi:hypothetical protein